MPHEEIRPICRVLIGRISSGSIGLTGGPGFAELLPTAKGDLLDQLLQSGVHVGHGAKTGTRRGPGCIW